MKFPELLNAVEEQTRSMDALQVLLRDLQKYDVFGRPYTETELLWKVYDS